MWNTEKQRDRDGGRVGKRAERRKTSQQEGGRKGKEEGKMHAELLNLLHLSDRRGDHSEASSMTAEKGVNKKGKTTLSS